MHTRCQNPWQQIQDYNLLVQLHYFILFCLTGLKAQLQGFAGMAMAYRYLMPGAICADGFTTKEATVFCMELGYEAAYVLPPLAVTSSMPIVLGALRCTGEERLLKNCNYPPFEVSIKNCTSRTAANVLCSKTKGGPSHKNSEFHSLILYSV